MRRGIVVPISQDLLDKIIKFASQLSTTEAVIMTLATAPVAASAIGGAYGLGHRSGRRYEVLHGQVPQLKLDLDETRFQVLELKQQLSSRVAEVRVLQETSEASRSTEIDLPADVQEVLHVRQLLLKDDVEVWRLRDAVPLVHLRERLIASAVRTVVIGNLKGGVGKTTLTANLAAYFAQRLAPLKKRVLVIDLDYQGSLTATLLQAASKRIDKSAAEFILAGQATGDWLTRVVKDVDAALPGVDLVPAGYTLAAMEELLMMRWLFHTTDKDVRFNLAEFLLSEEVRQTYGIVLLDVGPRLTTASISALCAATHLLVPTNLDKMSTETIGSFLSRVRALKESLNLPIELAGVVGTMTYQDRLVAAEEDAIGSIRDGLRQWGDDDYVFKRNVPRRQVLATVAGTDIGYRRNKAIRELFNTLGDELASRIKL